MSAETVVCIIILLLSTPLLIYFSLYYYFKGVSNKVIRHPYKQGLWAGLVYGGIIIVLCAYGLYKMRNAGGEGALGAVGLLMGIGLLGLISFPLIGMIISERIIMCHRRNLEMESKAFVDRAILDVIRMPDVNVLQKYAHNSFKEIMSEESVKGLFNAVVRLGKFIDLQGSLKKNNKPRLESDDLIITADYIISARFEKGKADFEISLINERAGWLIRGLKMSPRVG